MAKRMTQFYIKQSQNTFSNPVKIGSSAQYITMEDKEEDVETLKSYCDRIGDPNNLTQNKPETVVQKRKLVDILNDTTAKANLAYNTATGQLPNDSIGQQKLKKITFTVAESEYPYNPEILSNTTLSTIIGRIVKWLQDLKNFKLNKGGGEVEGQLFSNHFLGAGEGIGIRQKTLRYRDSQGILSEPLLEYDDGTGLIDINSMYSYQRIKNNNSEDNVVEYYKYGDGRLVTIIRRYLSLSLSTSAINSNYKTGSFSFYDSYPVPYINNPTITYSAINPTTDASKISMYSFTSDGKTSPGTFEVINLGNANYWTGTVIVRAEGRWK